LKYSLIKILVSVIVLLAPSIIQADENSQKDYVINEIFGIKLQQNVTRMTELYGKQYDKDYPWEVHTAHPKHPNPLFTSYDLTTHQDKITELSANNGIAGFFGYGRKELDNALIGYPVLVRAITSKYSQLKLMRCDPNIGIVMSHVDGICTYKLEARDDFDYISKRAVMQTSAKSNKNPQHLMIKLDYGLGTNNASGELMSSVLLVFILNNTEFYDEHKRWEKSKQDHKNAQYQLGI